MDAVPLRRRLRFNAAMLEARVVREHVPHTAIMTGNKSRC